LIKYKNASDSEKETIKKQVMSIVGNDSREADEFLQPAVNS
jgi:hypothetical protein